MQDMLSVVDFKITIEHLYDTDLIHRICYRKLTRKSPFIT